MPAPRNEQKRVAKKAKVAEAVPPPVPDARSKAESGADAAAPWSPRSGSSGSSQSSAHYRDRRRSRGWSLHSKARAARDDSRASSRSRHSGTGHSGKGKGHGWGPGGRPPSPPMAPRTPPEGWWPPQWQEAGHQSSIVDGQWSQSDGQSSQDENCGGRGGRGLRSQDGHGQCSQVGSLQQALKDAYEQGLQDGAYARGRRDAASYPDWPAGPSPKGKGKGQRQGKGKGGKSGKGSTVTGWCTKHNCEHFRNHLFKLPTGELACLDPRGVIVL